MARPRKLNADWFPHDVNERNKPMVKAIRRKFSHLGYAVWTYLQETLTSSDLFRIKWDDVTVELLAADYDVEPEELIAIVEYAVKIGLLEIEDGFIFSAEHRNGLKPLLLKRERDLLFLDNKAKSKTDAGGAEIIDAENEPKTSENTTKKERNPKNEMIFDAENVEKTEPTGVFDAENRRKQGFSSIIGEFPFFKSKSNSKSNTHTVIPTWKGGVGENQTAEFLDWLDSAYPEIAAMAEPITEEQARDILAKFSAEDINRIIAAMDNKGAYKNKSAYSTFASFVAHDIIIKSRKADTGCKYTYNEVIAEVDGGRGAWDDFQFLAMPDGTKYWMRKIDIAAIQA